MEISIESIKTYLLDLQKQIGQMLQAEDPAVSLTADHWQDPARGEGHTHVYHGGKFIEQAGVNFSAVAGKQLPTAATNAHPELIASRFQALGLSVIIHPLNPYA